MMKRWGFLFGALFGGIAVWGYYALTTVTDDDLLSSALQDHCLPYVQSGETPFADIGRTPGVYDAVTPRDGFENGGLKMIYDGRFTAQWGELTSVGRTSRICELAPASGHALPPTFGVDVAGFVDRYTDIIGVPAEQPEVTEGPTTFGWFEDPSDQSRGLRVVMIVSPGSVGNVVVMDDLTN